MVDGVHRHAMVVLGTRPEALKLAPVILALREHAAKWRVSVVATGQHREMLAQALGSFVLVPDHDLDAMVANQTLAGLTATLLTRCNALFDSERPDVVLVQGDTTTVLSASLAAHYNRIRVAHVEAGLRTHDPYNPFPEEMNRRIVGALAHLHFSPTEWAAGQLRREGISPDRIEVTGNTIVDALLHMERSGGGEVSDETRALVSQSAGRLILVTCHRRESFGPDLGAVIDGVARVAERFPDHRLFFPVHLNPNVRAQVMPALAGVSNIVLSEPVDYANLLHVLKGSQLVITDSGGIQEEAPSYGVPFIVVRHTTERPEGIEAGFGRLVPPDADAILALATEWLSENRKAQLQGRPSPYGDGRAAERIVARLGVEFGA